MYEYRLKVTRIIDGDTVDGLIDLGFSTFVKKRIRLQGIDAPETRTRDKAEKEKRNMPKMKKGGTVKRNKPKPKKGSTVRGAGIARQGVRKAKIR